MPKKTMSNNTKKRKRKLRLKKSVRRTIAALMMITALIVAAVPVRDVSAEDDTYNLPSLDDILTGYPKTGDSTTVQAIGEEAFYYPMYNDSDEVDNDKLKYFKVSKGGTDFDFYGINTKVAYNNSTCWPVYKVSGTSGGGSFSCIKNYLGYDSGSPIGGNYDNNIDLTATVCETKRTTDYGVLNGEIVNIDGKTFRMEVSVQDSDPQYGSKYYHVTGTEVSEVDGSYVDTEEGESFNGYYGDSQHYSSEFQYLADGAFKDAQAVYVKLPDGLQKIGDGAFENCYNLQEVIFGGIVLQSVKKHFIIVQAWEMLI